MYLAEVKRRNLNRIELILDPLDYKGCRTDIALIAELCVLSLALRGVAPQLTRGSGPCTFTDPCSRRDIGRSFRPGLWYDTADEFSAIHPASPRFNPLV